MSTSQGTYVQVGQTPEVMRETYKCAEWGGGLELRIAGSTIAFPFKTLQTSGLSPLFALYSRRGRMSE